MEDSTVKQLREELARLAAQVEELETKVAKLEVQQEIPEEDMVAIGAALAAYFGYAPKVRAIRFGHQTRWAASARERVHDRSVPHVR